MKEQKTDFLQGSVYRNIWSLALPMMAAQLINLLYNVVDRMYIGRIGDAGAMALTGLGLCFPIITIVSAFASLFGSGGGPLCSIELGKGNEEEAERIMGNAFTMLLGTGIVLTGLGIAMHRTLLYWFGASDATYPFARDYILIYLCGTVLVMINLGMNGFLNSQGFGRAAMMTVTLGAAANIVLDPVFIFALGMGVKGAALATVLSQMLSCLWIMRFLTSPKAMLRLKRQTLRPQGRRVLRIAALGFSGFVMQANNGLVQIACNATLQAFGGDLYVGVMTVVNTVREILTMPVLGFTNGATPVISFDYGAGRMDRIKRSIRFITAAAVIYSLAAWALVFFFPRLFIRMFSGDGALVETAVPLLHLYFFGFFMMALQFAGQSTFLALGKSKQATFFSLLRKTFIVVPLTLLLPRVGGLGVRGVFMAEPVSNFVGGLACYGTMLWIVRRELKSR
ncbi:MATE family efflux transporter [Bacilliculturomica massiliensis]|uniref:MATE family efflux transporter n=1 Tax=Bacilliculturomica massiliensis TaxID=1917867 RepID=UPI0010300CCE|nr:MATE family efflux transporter [Bacilliculturomica massiliensis]